MPSTHKKNDGVVTDPQAKDVGPFGRAQRFIDNLTAGLIIDAAIKELMKPLKLLKCLTGIWQVLQKLP